VPKVNLYSLTEILTITLWHSHDSLVSMIHAHLATAETNTSHLWCQEGHSANTAHLLQKHLTSMSEPWWRLIFDKSIGANSARATGNSYTHITYTHELWFFPIGLLLQSISTLPWYLKPKKVKGKGSRFI